MLKKSSYGLRAAKKICHFHAILMLNIKDGLELFKRYLMVENV